MANFASDNWVGAHPEVLEAMQRCNEEGPVPAYGWDPISERAIRVFRRHFGESAQVYFVFNGTAANVLSIQALARPYHSVICAETSHLWNDECGAPERFTGCKLIAVPAKSGKLTPEAIAPHLIGFGDQHRSQPRVISITQSTELGTVYSPEETRVLAELAHRHGMFLHMDGARIANAAVSLGMELAEMTARAGVDVLSFGGTKNGLVFGEAVIFLRPELAEGFEFIRKQGMQLASKMRFVAAQFEALLESDLWLRSARHANRMAALLGEKIRGIPGIEGPGRVEANALFPVLPDAVIEKLQRKHRFYIWSPGVSPGRSQVRWMCSFETRQEDVLALANDLAEAMPSS